MLVHYDPKLPLRLACDASAYGLGAVLSHVMPDGGERPIAYASKTLSEREAKYAQVEKEAYALKFGVSKFHQYLCGRKFTLITDHRPLTTIFGKKGSLPAIAAARLERWAIILSTYTYDIEYRSSEKHANADGFSRLPLNSESPEDDIGLTVHQLQLNQISTLPVSGKELAQATATDPVLSKVLTYVLNGWPARVEADLQPYYAHRLEITANSGCLMWGMRVIIPPKLRPRLLKELHDTHMGVLRMKSLAKLHLWWPKIYQDIERLARECESCQTQSKNPPRVVLHPWQWPNRPFQRIHIDFAEPYLGQMFLIVTDAYSKWLEVTPMTGSTSSKTIRVLRELFARFGCPELLVSDNGPQFTSSDFEEFLATAGVRHITTAPYHPQSNGAAERNVQTLKNAMKAMEKVGSDLHAKLQPFLFQYRNTPHATTGVTPSELFLGRHVRTRLSMLRPEVSERIYVPNRKSR